MRNKTYANLELLVSHTKQQKPIINFFRSNNISILTADPGCGKSFCAIWYALDQLKNNSVDKIVISKPLIEVGSSIGFLPGSEAEKTAVYLESYYGAITKILGEQGFKSLINSKKIEFKPVNYCRGTNRENEIVIMDEAQGLTLHELVTFATRIADSSKLLILGDPYQCDIKRSGLLDFINISKNIDGIGHMDLGEEFQMRNKIIVQLYKNYKKHLEKNVR